ncbi:MAG: ABC transporter ATP-binding protein, partial [Actinobacteria bacterium]|nr:ABC transporter ATP-binding protein [Actinomycetota bacterium]
IVDDPKVLLLDEPTSGLEEAEAEKFGEIVSEVRHETGCAVLLVEHDVPFVMGLCDRITVLNLGEVIAEGTPAEVSSNDLVRAAYLG